MRRKQEDEAGECIRAAHAHAERERKRLCLAQETDHQRRDVACVCRGVRVQITCLGLGFRVQGLGLHRCEC